MDYLKFKQRPDSLLASFIESLNQEGMLNVKGDLLLSRQHPARSSFTTDPTFPIEVLTFNQVIPIYLVVSLLFERSEEIVRGSREEFSHRQTPFIKQWSR
jgi:hypothetical protein